MSYEVFLDGVLLPVTPSAITTTINSKNDTIILINEGEVNLLKKAGLTDISFDCMLPNTYYPFAMYYKKYRPAAYFLSVFELLKTRQKPFQFIVLRMMPYGKLLYNTNMTVSMEDYEIKESKDDGMDLTVSVKLKQYRPFGTKKANIKKPDEKKKEKEKPKAAPQPSRSTASSPKPTQQAKTYTVKRGDCLWNIAKKFYGNGADYTKIAAANSNIKNPNLIYPGQVFTIPV